MTGGAVSALEGIVIADFSRVLAGPFATMILGDFGADVIKIEQRTIGDATRAWGPPFQDDGESAYYLTANRNKRSVELDLDSNDDLEIAREIVSRADVVVENFKPGTMERFGLGCETLRGANPALIYCKISGIGKRGVPGYDFLAQALSGLMSVTGASDGPPTKVGVPIVDVLVGLHASIGVLTALHHRQRTGVGQRVDVDLMSSALSVLVNQGSNFLVTGETPHRLGNAHPNIVPYQTFATSTGAVAVAVGTDRQFETLCRALNLEDEVKPAWRTNPGRVADREAVVGLLAVALRDRVRDDVLAILDAAGVPCSPVNSVGEAFEYARSVGLDPIVEIERPDGRTVATVRNPIELGATPASYRVPPPYLGEHSQHVVDWVEPAPTPLLAGDGP